MKILFGFALLLLVSFSNAKIAVTIYNSLDEFKATNPGVKVTKLQAYDHQVDASRTYSVGGRQTGEVLNLEVS
jgi:hypothetical protein